MSTPRDPRTSENSNAHGDPAEPETLSSAERDEVLDDERVEHWNNGPSSEQVQESLARRTLDEDSPAEAGKDAPHRTGR